jgi:hypothetical protein
MRPIIWSTIRILGLFTAGCVAWYFAWIWRTGRKPPRSFKELAAEFSLREQIVVVVLLIFVIIAVIVGAAAAIYSVYNP